MDSKTILVPIGLVTKQDPQQLTQDPSVLPTNNTTITQSEIQPTPSRNFDPPPPLEYGTPTSSSTCQQSIFL